MIPMIMGCCAQSGLSEPPVPTLFTVFSDGTSATQALKIEVVSGGEPVFVDWGDGETQLVTTNATHMYPAGTFTGSALKGSGRLSISGRALISVENIQNGLSGIHFCAFGGGGGSPNLVAVPAQIPESIRNLQQCFRSASSFNGDITGWDVSKVTVMAGMFDAAIAFNRDISGWDTGSVTSMGTMFYQATAFNQDLSGWNVGNVTIMTSMFAFASAFDGDISNWDVSNVTDMEGMFEGALNFDGDISNWDVSNVTKMNYMFSGAESFNGDISNWDVSNVTNMDSMFRGATAFNGNISGWDVSNVTNMNTMFSDASSFNQDLSGWCVSNISSTPFEFDFNAVAWTLPRPVWGTCPNG